MTTINLPPDQTARETILQKLESNLLVEAAAGTGKTTSMVGRMTALVAEGHCEIQRLAAVTFTRKAAAELRTRFRLEIEQRAATADGPARDRLRLALSQLDQCFIGTIHSFCGRLLRERTVEAGVEFSFTEIDDEEDECLRDDAWRRSVAKWIATSDPMLEALREVGLRVSQLAPAFQKFAQYTDVEDWPAPLVQDPDYATIRTQVSSFLVSVPGVLQGIPRQVGSDTLIPRLRHLLRLRRHLDIHKPSELMELLEAFDYKPKVTKTKFWPDETTALSELHRFEAFRDNFVRPTVTHWRAFRYSRVLAPLREAAVEYEQLRRAKGGLNFQDLLVLAARLLRDHPNVRQYFRRRISHLLVDEFQDTDPIQAEVMLLLTADDPHQTDWRKCRPVPGSLFVVGDPKQSIYRFRRADIVTYNEVKRILVETGGEVVTLSANFRTIPTNLNWVNGCFSPKFPPQPTSYSPSYVPFTPGRVEGSEGECCGIYRFDLPDDLKNNSDIYAYETRAIAAFIRESIDNGRTIPRTLKEIERGIPSTVQPGDFMIVAWRTAALSRYAAALEEYGIPHEVTGGTALNETLEVALLHQMLDAVLHPDDPIGWAAVLRGELFGISDDDLYTFVQLNGAFDYRKRLPPGIAPGFIDACDKALSYASWFRTLPPISAIERIVDDLGLIPLALVREGGREQAGAIFKTIELLRAQAASIWSPVELVDYLGEIVARERKHDSLSLADADRSVVRVMNLHKVKGLEAPFVFLADLTGDREHPIGLHVDRSGPLSRGYLCVSFSTNPFGSHHDILAHPDGWTAFEEEERKFLEGEKDRLLYVAATRAGTALVLTQRKGRADSNPWNFFGPYLMDSPPFVPGACDPPCIDTVESEFDTALQLPDRGEILQRRASCLVSSYQVESPSQTGRKESASTTRSPDPYGAVRGTLIHRMMELLGKSPQADIDGLADLAVRDLLEEIEEENLQGILEDCRETVREMIRSDLWRRALASPRRFVELPFFIRKPGTAASAQHFVRGSIDLIFEEKDGWVLVDYKTDADGGTHPHLVFERHKAQLAQYVEAWQAINAGPIAQAGLYITRGSGEKFQTLES